MRFNNRNNDGSKIKTVVLIVFVLIIIMGLLTSCAKPEEPAASESDEDHVTTIGMSFDSFLIERWEKDRDVFVARAREEGIEVNVQNANGDCDTQIEQIKYFIDKKVDAIVIVAIDAGRLTDVVRQAKDAGIIVVAYDRNLRDAGADLYVSFDNHQVGVLMAESLASQELEKKAVLMLSGPTEDDNVLQVNAGFKEVCEENGIKVAGIYYTPGWKPEYAVDYLEDNFDVLDRVDAVMCGNDNIATQVFRLLAERRRAGQIYLTGQDGDLEACQRIVQGTQLVTGYKPVEKEAKAAAEATIALIRGEKPAGVNDVISDGSYDVNAIILDPIAVTKENMDETIIDSGFHLKDDVYLYAPAGE